MTVLVEMSGSAASLQVDRKGQPYYRRCDAAHRAWGGRGVYSRVDPCGQPWGLGVGYRRCDAAHRAWQGVYSRVDPCGQPWGLGVGLTLSSCHVGDQLAVNLGGWAWARLKVCGH